MTSKNARRRKAKRTRHQQAKSRAMHKGMSMVGEQGATLEVTGSCERDTAPDLPEDDSALEKAEQLARELSAKNMQMVVRIQRNKNVIDELKRHYDEQHHGNLVLTEELSHAQAEFDRLLREVRKIPAWIRWLCGVSV